MSVQVADVGSVIRLKTGVDLAGADSVAMKYRKPNRQTGTWTATALTEVNADTGVTEYFGTHTTESGDIAATDAGTWELQLLITNLDGFTGHTPIGELTVESIIVVV